MALDLVPRLAACSERLALLEAEAEAERERRNGLVTRAIEEGNTYTAVARAARLSRSHVATLVARTLAHAG